MKQFFARLFLWRLEHTVEVSENEKKKLNDATNDIEAKTIVWRAALMKAILPLSLAVFALEFLKTTETLRYYNEFDENYDYDTDLLQPVGKAALISDGPLSTGVLIVGICMSLYYSFSDLKRSSKIVRWAFMADLLLILWPSLVQSDAKFGFDEIIGMEFMEDPSATIATIRLQSTVTNAINLIPLIIAFPRGSTKAALCLFGLFPKATTPKVLIMYFFPFASILLLLGASTFVQVAGGPLIGLALGCFFACDALMYLSYKYVIEGDTEKLATSKKAKVKLYISLVGLVLLVVWFASRVVPCAFLDDDELYYGKAEPHCVVLANLQFPIKNIVVVIIKFFRNLFLGKLIFFDTMMLTLQACEPEFEVVKSEDDVEVSDGDVKG
eukprot:CAMPEP_0204648474 /NCGR_PEP_ID=MMETSP0718-20130828/7870_1 /ASSEMBLY_ACC=CAM_ASM_000674 /TAXON_ID=230516 /ORGANISM="Chaetoceros curvisetus" /LENGTH=382 /DNA_ID=CAMNT_0051671315 /DNA_START=68 /DNA_END=1216 /DNA_ORIENTATION=-